MKTDQRHLRIEGEKRIENRKRACDRNDSVAQGRNARGAAILIKVSAEGEGAVCVIDRYLDFIDSQRDGGVIMQ